MNEFVKLLSLSVANDDQGVSAVAGGVMPVLKRPALIDAKTGLPVYRQLTATSYPPHVAAINAVQAIQPQPPFISFPCKYRTSVCRNISNKLFLFILF